MIITKKWLEGENACKDGKEWFLNQPETDGIKVVEQLIVNNKLQWANWLIVRIKCKLLNEAIKKAEAANA